MMLIIAFLYSDTFVIYFYIQWLNRNDICGMSIACVTQQSNNDMTQCHMFCFCEVNQQLSVEYKNCPKQSINRYLFLGRTSPGACT